MSRTALILGVVALGLLAFIVVFERGTVSTGERDQRRGRVLETFLRDKVVRLELQRKGVTVVLTRKPLPEEGLDLGPFEVEAPFRAKADNDAVDSVLGGLEWVDARRTLHDVSAADLAKFGLDAPRYRVVFVVGRERGFLTVGHDTPEGGSVYVQAGDPKTAFVVGKDVIEALDHEPSHFHTKELHATAFTIYGARRITLRDDTGERVVEKRGDYFWLVRPELRLASEPAVTELVTNLDGLLAQRFVTREKKPAAYGLDAPRFEAVLESETYGALPKPGEKPHAERMHLRVGKPCAGHDGESYVSVDEGAVMCASDADLAKLQQSVSALRDMRLLVLDEAQVRGVRVQSAGRELVLSEQGDGWRYKVTERGRDQASGVADASAVGDWLKALRAQTAEQVTGAPAPSVGGAVGEATVVTFERGKDKSPYRVVFGESADRLAVGRIDEPATLLFSPQVLELVDVSTARFRKHALLDENEADFRSVVVARRDGAREVVTKDKTGAYAWTAPVQAALERTTVDEIVRLFSKLEAVRFVADAPAVAHGLASPEYKLEVEYRAASGAPRRHVLRIGAPTDAGRHAQLDAEPAVFVVAEVLVAQLREPLVSRAALATPLEALAALRIEHAGKVVQVERSGEGFVVDGVAHDARERGQALSRAIATLRVTRVLDYGASAESDGTGRPQARVVVTTTGPAPVTHTLRIGNSVGTDANADVYVRRSDLSLGFTLPRAAVDQLLEQRAPSEPATQVEPK